MTAKFYGKAEEVVNKIIENFEAGNMPSALSQTFMQIKDSRPMSNWSRNNQIIAIISGTNDGRTYNAWKKVGRCVIKGEKAFNILQPTFSSFTKKDDAGKETRVQWLNGFKSLPEFRLESTEIIDQEKWDKSQADEKAGKEKANKYLESLPLREVAEAWGIKLEAYNGKSKRALGYFSPTENIIALGVENLSTWTHELIHASEKQNGKLTTEEYAKNKVEAEIVAELGGATLLKMLGQESDADLGGAWNYIKHYADGDKGKTIKKILSLTKRTAEAIETIVETIESLETITEGVEA